MLPRRAVALAAFSLALAMSLASLAGPAAAAAPAPLPTWTVGQSVAYGTHLDLGALLDTYVLNPIRHDAAAYNITSIQALNATGSFDLWEVDQVTGKTDTYYVLNSTAAEGTQLDLLVNVTVNILPKAGTYNGTHDPYLGCIAPTVPTTTGTIALHLNVTSLTTTNGTTRYEVSNLTYLNETQNAHDQSKLVVSTYNVPMVDLNQTTCQETVTYDSPSFTLTTDTQDQIRATFDPTWDYFNFPINDNETWWANSTATVGATLSGTVNVQGLSSKQEASFFDNLTKAFQGLGLVVSGLDHFPIDLAKITVTAGLQHIVQNGVVEDTPVPVRANYRAIASVMTLSDNNQYPVYLITNASYYCSPSGGNPAVPFSEAAIYAPDFPAQGAGMIVGYELVTCVLGTNQPLFSLTNTKPTDARHHIAQTETQYQIAPAAAGNPLADFFLQAPYWGILIIAAVVIVAVAGVLLLRRRRPAVPPPPPPPAP